ncbi:MAG: amino acid synthesis family protein [Rhodospirillaceae bacterium]|nr:amino acid synthesis family protein [Rhodospirillaceae bacterium]MCY4237724.1 amino acid synthesis family protein [Rhodospirillaceae bacterium]
MSDLIAIRKIVTATEEIRHEGGPEPAVPRCRGAITVVMKNPYAGRYVEDIVPMMEALTPVGLDMAGQLIKALGGDASRIDGYGKGAIVGEAGELEHGALWHVPGGYAMRELLGDARAIVPSSKKVGGVGTRLDVPITHINASYVRGHFDAMETGVADAPKADEIAFILVMSIGSRIHDRVGGLKAAAIKGEDGLR